MLRFSLPAVLLALVASVQAADPLEVAGKVDASLLAELPNDAARPMQKVGDEEFLRRVYLDIIGHIPEPGEVTAFVLDPATNKRAKIVEKLLADERWLFDAEAFRTNAHAMMRQESDSLLQRAHGH